MIDSSSQKKKIVLIALLAVASVVAIGAFFGLSSHLHLHPGNNLAFPHYL